ncbi:peptidylprolyl isomerase [Candidatus Woesearchaeota archaeon]|nr:peptidylprolyl isomerase [Candidatus Woesearchaeota archaeon]
MAIKKGDKVKIHYTGKFKNGDVFDSSEGKAPLEFEAGKGMVIKGLDEEIIDMKIGDKKTIEVPPEKAYGQRQNNLLAEVPRDKLPKNLDIKKGMMLTFQNEKGVPFTAKIVDFDDNSLKLDLNHPLAGKTLVFDIEVVGKK